MIQDYDVPQELIQLVPNGVEVARFQQRVEKTSNRLELGFLGRLEHRQKGVMHLPKIIEHLNAAGISYRLQIAGTGIHEIALRKELAPEIATGRVEFVGLLPRTDVPDYLRGIDVFLFPSHFEGCPNALLEAMAAGCIPVSWIIPGITDYIIEHGKTGFLVNNGDCKNFANQIIQLSHQKESLLPISQSIREMIEERFSTERCAELYSSVLVEALKQPINQRIEPKSWSQFEPHPRFRQKWAMLPSPIRSLLKRCKQLVSRN